MQFLAGIGIETGLDISQIDGLKVIEQVYEHVGDLFFIKDHCQELMDDLQDQSTTLNCNSSRVALEGLLDYKKCTDALDAQYVRKVAERRSLAAGNSNVVMLRRDPTLETMAKRGVHESIRPLSACFGRDDTSSDDVKEFLTGLGIRSDDNLYFNGHSVRDAMRNVISTMAKIKLACQKTLVDLNSTSQVSNATSVSRTVSYMKCQIDAIHLREQDYLERVEMHQMYATGKVVPFRR